MSLKNRKQRHSSIFLKPPLPRRCIDLSKPKKLTEKTAAFPSSEAFEVINAALKSSDAERKDAMKQGNAVFAFVLKNKAGEEDTWNIDLKTKGEVSKGLGDKPTGMYYLFTNQPHTGTNSAHSRFGLRRRVSETSSKFGGAEFEHTNTCLVTLTLSDDDFGKLVSGKANAQRLFMGGKLKVKGDVMKATKLDPILKKAQAVKSKL